jgi:hypothetical protein
VSQRRSHPRLRAAVDAAAIAAVCAAGVLASIALLGTPAGSRRPATRGAATSAPARPGTPGATSAPGRAPLESMFQDDRLLIYSPTATVTRTLNQLRALGVQRLRLTILWSAIAPDPLSPTAPAHFDASRPSAYPAGAWAPYDRVLELARQRGIGVDFDVTAPGPRWAMAPGAPVAAQASHYAPSAADFGQFVLALARRYSGAYLLRGQRVPLPRVDYWSVWNEPNQPGWLAPQWQTRGGAPTIAAARLYRGYVDAAFGALARSGHRSDTILIGELAPEGVERTGESAPVPPVPFLEALYCVDRAYTPLHGAPARALGCPGSGNAHDFAAAHPELFASTGFAHHPYSFFLGPAAGMRDANFVPLADLTRLEQDLDRIFATYSVARQLPIYLTEYGYETNPPNPFRGIGPATQAAYLGEAEYLAWLDPRVRTLSQFLLRDAAPNPAFPRGSVRYWSTFQTGLEYQNGRAKPALDAYRLPIFIPVARFSRGARIAVWAMLRPARGRAGQRAQIQWRGRRGPFRTLGVALTREASGALVARVTPPGTGEIRVLWSDSHGRRVHSRSVAVAVAG